MDPNAHILICTILVGLFGHGGCNSSQPSIHSIVLPSGHLIDFLFVAS